MKKLLMAGLVSAVVVGGQIDSVEAACASQSGFFAGGSIGAAFTKVKVKQDGSFLTKDAQELLKLLRAALEKVGSLVTEATNLQTDAQKGVDDKKSSLDTAQKDVTTAESAYSTAKTAYGKTVDVAAKLLASAFVSSTFTVPDPTVIDSANLDAAAIAAGTAANVAAAEAAAAAVLSAMRATAKKFFGTDADASLTVGKLPAVLKETFMNVRKKLCAKTGTAYTDGSGLAVPEYVDDLIDVVFQTMTAYQGFGATAAGAVHYGDVDTYTPNGKDPAADADAIPVTGPEQVAKNLAASFKSVHDAFVEVLTESVLGYGTDGNLPTVSPDGSVTIIDSNGKEVTAQLFSLAEGGVRVTTVDKTGALSVLGTLQDAASIPNYAEFFKASTACGTAYKDVVSNKEKVVTAEKSLAEANAALQKTNYAVENQSKVLEAAVKKADDEKGRLAALTTKTVDETIKEVEAEAVSEYGLANGKASKSGAGFLYGLFVGGRVRLGDIGVGAVVGLDGNTFKRKFSGSTFSTPFSLRTGAEFSVVLTPTFEVYACPSVEFGKYRCDQTGEKDLSVNVNSVLNRAKSLSEAVDAAYTNAETTSKTKETAAKATNATDAVKIESENAIAVLTVIKGVKELTDPFAAYVTKVENSRAEIQKKHNKTKANFLMLLGFRYYFNPTVAFDFSLGYRPTGKVFDVTQTGNRVIRSGSTTVRAGVVGFF